MEPRRKKSLNAESDDGTTYNAWVMEDDKKDFVLQASGKTESWLAKEEKTGTTTLSRSRNGLNGPVLQGSRRKKRRRL